MKSVIDIDEYEYEQIKKYYERLPNDSTVKEEIYCIANSKPLSEVVGDIKAEIQNIYVGYRQGYEVMAEVLKIIDKHIGG